MSIAELHIHSLRNIVQSNLSLNTHWNVIYGNNGSGKTTLLESLYLLSAGYSFKSRETSPLVHYGHPHLTLFSRTFDNDTISLRKMISGPTLAKLNGQTCQFSSDLSRFLPSQIFHQDLFQVIDAGPSTRRAMLDWGVFHVKHEYHSVWREYRHVLKQRNALLRQRPNQQAMRPWNELLVQHSEGLHAFRESYFQIWMGRFQSIATQLMEVDCHVEYYRGWDRRNSGKSLMSLLEEQFSMDCQRQYTHSGAHQADLMITTDHATAKRGLSRGQQKLVSIALKLAQGELLEKPCLYLFDDLTSELDATHVKKLMACLNGIKGQKVITVLDRHSIDVQDGAYYFSVDMGAVSAEII